MYENKDGFYCHKRKRVVDKSFSRINGFYRAKHLRISDKKINMKKMVFTALNVCGL
jgi:hypothetical protein